MMASETEYQPQFLPPGFRFHPTDEELIQHYLRKRAAGESCPVPIIAEVDIYKFNPWDLPSMAKQHHQQHGGDGAYGCREWYFFSPRDRKYPNGARPNRAAGSGYWKATGTDKPIVATSTATAGGERAGGRIGVKKALVFYKGKPPRGTKTNWIMHEYRLTDQQQPSPFHHVLHPVKNKDPSSMRLDDWVLCRIYEKTHSHQQIPGTPTEDLGIPAGVDDALEDSQHNISVMQQQPAAYPGRTSTGSLANSGSLSDILCGMDASDYSMLSRLLFTADNPHMNPPLDLHQQQQRQHSSPISGQIPGNVTTTINTASVPAGYFNNGNSVDSSGPLSTVVSPVSGLHQWPPLPQESPASTTVASRGFGLKRQREPTDGFPSHTDSTVTVLLPAKKEHTGRSSGFTGMSSTAGSNSCLLPGYGNLLGPPTHFGSMDHQAYQLSHPDMLPNPRYLGFE